MVRVIVIVAVIVVAAALLSHVPAAPSFAWPGQGVSERSEASYPFQALGTLQVNNASGDVQITGTDSITDSIDVMVTKHASNRSELDALTARVGGNANGVVIATDYPQMCTDCDVSYSIRVPRSAIVAIDDDSGEIHVRGTSGIITVKAASGDVHLQDDSGAVSLDMDSGDASLSNVTGAARVINSSGDIDAHGLANSIDFGSSSGDVTASFANFDDVKMVQVQTSSGSIKVTAPKPFGARISAQTSSGSMDSDMSLPIHENDSGADLSVSVGSGNALMQLSSDSGDITINGNSD